MPGSELKEELEARGESKTGNKAWLRRRLHAAIVRAHLEEEDGLPASPATPTAPAAWGAPDFEFGFGWSC